MQRQGRKDTQRFTPPSDGALLVLSVMADVLLSPF